MKPYIFECSVLLEKILKRSEWNAATLSQHADVPSEIITSYEENGDFRFVSDLWMIERLFEFLKNERQNYVKIALPDYTDDELLLEIKNRLISG